MEQDWLLGKCHFHLITNNRYQSSDVTSFQTIPLLNVFANHLHKLGGTLPHTLLKHDVEPRLEHRRVG